MMERSVKKMFSKKFIRTKTHPTQLNVNEKNVPEEKFSGDIKLMDNYMIIDVKSLDTKSYEDGLQLVKNIDTTNKTFLRYCKRRLEILYEYRNKNNLIKNAVIVNELTEPPCYETEYNLHRERNKKINIRYSFNCARYLELKGYFIVDSTTVLDATSQEIGIPSEKIIEPYQVIEMAKKISKQNGEHIETIIKKNVQSFATSIKSMTSSMTTIESVVDSVYINPPTAPQPHRTLNYWAEPVTEFR